MRKTSLFPLYLVNFIGTLGFSIVLPFLVFLVDDFGGNALIYGLLGATYSAFQLIGAPILGNMSDRVGRRKILLFSQIGTAIAWLVFLWALFFPVKEIFKVSNPILGIFVLTLPLLTLFFARALDGITGGNVSVANAYLADASDEKDMKKNFGKMSVSSNLGFIVGPVLAGVLGATSLGATLPVIIALVISVIAIFVIGFYLKDINQGVIKEDVEGVNVNKVFGQEQKQCYKMKGAEKTKLKDIFKIKNVPYIMLLYFMIFLGFNIFYAAFPIHAIKGLGWSVLEMGIFFSVMGGLMVIVQGPVLSRVSGKYSDSFLVIVGSVILGTAFLFLMSSGLPIIYAGVLFFSVGNGLMWPSFMSLLSKNAGKELQGAVQGFASSSGSLASIIGLITGGILYGLIGSLTFLVSAIVIYAVFLMSFGLRGISGK